MYQVIYEMMVDIGMYLAFLRFKIEWVLDKFTKK